MHDLMRRLIPGRLHRLCETCVSVVAVVARTDEKGASASAGLPDGFRGIHECAYGILPLLQWTEVTYLALRYNHSSDCVKVVHEKPADKIVLVAEPVLKVTCTVEQDTGVLDSATAHNEGVGDDGYLAAVQSPHV